MTTVSRISDVRGCPQGANTDRACLVGEDDVERGLSFLRGLREWSAVGELSSTAGAHSREWRALCAASNSLAGTWVVRLRHAFTLSIAT
jgi:hypothetical protein